jgi:hypothetical protein
MHPTLDDLLSLRDGALAPPGVASHVAECAACRASLDEVTALGTALRSMPLLTPPGDGWARISARLAPARVVHPATARWRLASAGLAASLALVAVLATSGRLAAPVGEVVPELVPLADLQHESQRLESVLADMGGARVVSASAAGEIADLEDHIAALDWQLSSGADALDADQRHALWARRVELMQDLVLVRAGSSRDGRSM